MSIEFVQVWVWLVFAIPVAIIFAWFVVLFLSKIADHIESDFIYKSPDLIDLEQYEKNLLYCVECDKPLIPVQPIPNPSKWGESELQMMRENRYKAGEIYRKYKERTGND